jgi:hypothetical protein
LLGWFIEVLQRVTQTMSNQEKRLTCTAPATPQNNRPTPSQGSIFLPMKLAHLLRRRDHDHAEEHRPSVVSLIRSGVASAVEATSVWGVAHPSYWIDLANPNQILIRHTNLDARVPEVFTTLDEAHAGMAKLLMGEKVGSEGDFVYFGQPLVHCRARTGQRGATLH